MIRHVVINTESPADNMECSLRCYFNGFISNYQLLCKWPPFVGLKHEANNYELNTVTVCLFLGVTFDHTSTSLM